MRRVGLAVVLALLLPASAQARYLHKREALSVIAHAHSVDERSGAESGHVIEGLRRQNAHSFYATVQMFNVADTDGTLAWVRWTEHIWLHPDGVATLRTVGTLETYRERLYSGSVRNRGV